MGIRQRPVTRGSGCAEEANLADRGKRAIILGGTTITEQKQTAMHEIEQDERALLVALETHESEGLDSLEARMDELAELAATAGVHVLGRASQKRRQADSAYLIGHGKADELAAEVKELGATLVIFDDELSPTQQRNLGETLQTRVIDRTQLILDIFAQRARTREGKLQVELARLSYLLPRLGSLYTKFERQQGGIGVRGGGGETKLELDRRKVRERIGELERELDEVVKQRRQQRAGRHRTPFPTAALVGYTSAGKSTLLNTLSGSNILADRMLFSTLDPTTRRVVLPDGRGILLTDTVGFIRNLPHDLVAAFRATLEEVTDADFLIHVVDTSAEEADRHRDTVLETLDSLGAGDRPLITVFNKSDLVTDRQELQNLITTVHNSVYLSAVTRDGIVQLMDKIVQTIKGLTVDWTMQIPYNRSDLVALCYEFGHVVSADYQPEFIEVRAELAKSMTGRFEEFVVWEKSRSRDVEQQFEQELREGLSDVKKEFGYSPAHYLRAVRDWGGLEAAHKLLQSETYQGEFLKLWKLGRLDATVEHAVLDERFADLFSPEERQTARQRMDSLNFAAGEAKAEARTQETKAQDAGEEAA